MTLIVEHLDLSELNTLGVHSFAKYGAEVRNVDELQRVLKWYRSQPIKLPFMVLGGGSNVVLSGDFPGLAIHIRMSGIEEVAENDDAVWIKAAAGENWHGFVEFCLNYHYWGLENLALIPGTVGAAPIQNIGAYGVELSDRMSELTAVDIQTGLEIVFQNDACDFGYRDSVFKGRLRDRYIITSVTFKLPKSPQVNLSYPELARFFSDINDLSPDDVFQGVIAIRQQKLPDPAQIPNVGSFFKNPVVSAEDCQRFEAQGLAVPTYVMNDGRMKLAAGWLIDQAGWKGRELAGVGVHKSQALVLINPSRSNGKNVLNLASAIQADIYQKYGVSLEIEPRIY